MPKVLEAVNYQQQLHSNFFFQELVICIHLKNQIRVCYLLLLVYRFAHRSFQEYFAAWYTCKLTDDIQRKLLQNWIKESDSVLVDAYFQMLFNLQSEKVNKIILCPIIVEIREIYNQLGFSIELIKKMFDNISIRKIKRNRKES